jgi:hypothetical protein
MNTANLVIANNATSFKFNTLVANGSTYAVNVAIQPIGETCLAMNNSGTINSADITNIIISCSANSSGSSSSSSSETAGPDNFQTGIVPTVIASTAPVPDKTDYIATPNYCATTVNTQSGISATLGAPSTTLFNGIQIVQDMEHRCAKHAVDTIAGTMPAPLVNPAMPYIQQLKVISRRDSIILYLPNVAGAADYRAYVVDNNVTFNGTQPRNAVIACAGYRDRHYDLVLNGATPWRELLQELELPGLTTNGNYTVVVEAITTPCPFTGVMSASDNEITVNDKTNAWSGNSHASFRSFDTVRSLYGNEIINGQGSQTSWTDRMNLSVLRGTPVDPNSTVIPKDPTVIARSAIAITKPAVDEAVNAPVIDVGANSMVDDFSDNLVVSPSSITNNFEMSNNNGPWFAPLATIPGRWAFWGDFVQHVDGESGLFTNVHGLQLFQRYGRLYQTSGDAVQCCMTDMLFSSLKTLPQQLDQSNQKYVHSFFRVNSDASSRRYWVWLMCGGDTQGELVDLNTHMPLFRPFMDPGDFGPMSTVANSFTGKNPSMQHGLEPNSTTRYNKECLQFVQIGGGDTGWPSGRTRTNNRMFLVLHPKDVAQGTISYGTSGSEQYADPNFPAWAWRVDASGNYNGPMMEPFDQISPLTHFDVFVRPDRVVVFINGRQAICANITSRPLTMKYGLIMYGSVLYHSSAEQEESEVFNMADYHYRLNEPISDTRSWDSIGHSQMMDIPTNIFTTFDPSLCTNPVNVSVQ